MSEVTIPANPQVGTTVSQTPGGPVQVPASADPAAFAAHTQNAMALGQSGDYHNGRLTLDGMRRVIARGGSVSLYGRIIAHQNDLPTETQLARDNAAADRQALIVRRSNLSAREQQAHNAGNYDLQKPELDAERVAIDKEAARITAASAENEQDAIQSIQTRRAQLDAEEQQLKAAQASAPKPVAKK